MDHGAFPSKFDGIGVSAEGDAQYDDPAFYAEAWDDLNGWDRWKRIDRPTMASARSVVSPWSRSPIAAGRVRRERPPSDAADRRASQGRSLHRRSAAVCTGGAGRIPFGV